MEQYNSTFESETKARFQFFVRAFRNAGIPLLLNKPSKLFILYDKVCMICLCLTTASMTMDAIMNTEDLERTMETVRALAPVAMITWMYGFFRWRVNAMERLMRLTESFSWEDLKVKDSETGSVTTAGLIPRIKFITQNTIIFSLFFHYTYTIVRILWDSNRPLSYNSWYPFDTSGSPVFEVIITTQVVAAFSYINVSFAFDGLYATLISIACTQLEKLEENMLNIAAEIKVNCDFNTEKRDEDVPQEAFQLMQKKLNDFIQHHQSILSYVEILEDTLNPAMAGIFLLELLSLCFASFSIVTSWGNYIQMAQGVTSYVLLSLMLACYCWFGSQLSFKAEKVKDAAFGCNWIGTPISLQRNLALIITRCNKEVTLTAGKFIPINIKTMMNMINQSVSYFMFLLEVKDKIDNTEQIESN